MTHDNSYVEKEFNVVGTRFSRPDGIDKVTGKARYGADASAPGQLIGKVLRSPHAHAQILKINTSKAPLHVAIELEGETYGRLRSSNDFKEGVSSFVKKRKPVYKGN